MKKYAFFKYFIKNRVYAGGGGAGARRPIPSEGGVGCSTFTPQYSLGTRAGAWKRGRGCLNTPLPALLPCLSTSIIHQYHKLH